MMEGGGNRAANSPAAHPLRPSMLAACAANYYQCMHVAAREGVGSLLRLVALLQWRRLQSQKTPDPFLANLRTTACVELSDRLGTFAHQEGATEAHARLIGVRPRAPG